MNGLDIPCSENARLGIFWENCVLRFEFTAPGIDRPGHRVFLAIEGDEGSSILPAGRGMEGSNLFLPFSAGILFSITNSPNPAATARAWNISEWGPWTSATQISTTFSPDRCSITLTLSGGMRPAFVIYAKDLTQNDGWGALIGANDRWVTPGPGDKYIAGYTHLTLGDPPSAEYRTRLETPTRPRIYQLFIRLFGNVNETRKVNGTIEENGVGKFADINDAALDAIRGLGCTHIWLTGIQRQATTTDYSSIGLPPDDPALVKGRAGSPYAVRDAFDLCPDYALDPAQRLDEFKALLARIHAHGLAAIIDLVPNHVARAYNSTIRPDLSFGATDDPSQFFDPRNNFYYLRPSDPGGGPPLKLPTRRGPFQPEIEHGRVTGNNAVTWAPSINDWYEAVKLNYGIDFTHTADRRFPLAANPSAPIPDTWHKIDEIIAFWQATGVDGFRCDMSHMIPPEFWAWAIRRARARNPHTWFMGEAYNDDPAKLPPADPTAAALGNVMHSLLNAGFNAVYDHPSYKTLKAIYDGPKWANDFDGTITPGFICQNSLRYAENHDEIRLSARGQWGDIGMEVGRPVTAILFGAGRGPLMIYNGQEVGEPGAGIEGFGGNDARTTIFDYWSMPETVKWVNHHQYDGALLSEQQKSLRAWYSRLLNLVGEPGFRFGGFRPLNPANYNSENFGRAPGDPVSGHWMYAFLRYDIASGQRWLVVANLHRSTTFQPVRIHIPPDLIQWLRLPAGASLTFTDHLADSPTLTASAADLPAGLVIPQVSALSASYYEIA
jgi:glycosidase